MVQSSFHTFRIYLYLCTACMSSAVMSVAAAWSSPALARLTSNCGEVCLSRAEVVGIQAALPAAAVPGLLGGWALAETLGRRAALMLGGCLSLVAWPLLGVTPHFTPLLAGRLLNGLAVGCLNIGAALYIPEIAPKELAGTIFAVAQVFTNLGCLLEFGLGPFLPLWALSAVSASWALGFTLLSFFLPESPYFLVATGRRDRARTVLVSLRATKDVDQEMDVIQSRAGSETGPWGRARTLWREGRHLHGTLVVFGACLLKQVTGGVALLSYAQPVFILSGVSLPSGLSSLILGSVKTFGSCFTPCLARRFTLKALLILSCTGVALFLMILTVFLYLMDERSISVNYLNWLPLFCMIFYFIFLDFGIGPFPSFLGSETLEWGVRGAGVTVALALSQLFTAGTMAMLITWYLPFTLATFAASAMIAIPLLYFFMKDIHKVPEVVVTHL